MSNEKHNEALHWKNKLDELTSLPGEVVSEKNVIWEKLHDRLQDKPRKKKAVWYWAAACLLLALSITLVMTNKKDIELVKEVPQQKQDIIAPVNPLVLSKEPATVINTVQVKTKQKTILNRKKPDQIILNNAIKDEQPVVLITDPPVENILNPTTIDTAATAVTAITPKKKLQVIHINDLEAPPAPIALPNYVKNSLKVKFGNKAAGQLPQYAGSFKINLSLKN